MSGGALHIASLVVRARPESAALLAERIAAVPGTEVHAVEDGKIIVVLEAANERGLADRMDELRHESEVLLVNLVFHQIDSGEIEPGQIDDEREPS